MRSRVSEALQPALPTWSDVTRVARAADLIADLVVGTVRQN
jgi:hypothetical protein